MANTPKFGNPEIAEKLAAQFGAPTDTITVEMKFAEQITVFLDKIEKAHEDAATSTLVFK